MAVGRLFIFLQTTLTGLSGSFFKTKEKNQENLGNLWDIIISLVAALGEGLKENRKRKKEKF